MEKVLVNCFKRDIVPHIYVHKKLEDEFHEKYLKEITAFSSDLLGEAERGETGEYQSDVAEKTVLASVHEFRENF